MISDLVSRLEIASHAYHNGLPETMTDDEYDKTLEKLQALDPTNPFLSRVGAPTTGDVELPIQLPSLNKAKPGSLDKWLSKFPAPEYFISTKLDGCSALWLPQQKKLYTRGDGIRGRDISKLVPHIAGLSPDASVTAVRGELIMRTDSHLIAQSKMARNIVAGALNRQTVEKELLDEIRFVAYELIRPSLSPSDAKEALRKAGYETARSTIRPGDGMTEKFLSSLFSASEKVSPYQMDGIVIAPNLARKTPPVTMRNGAVLNPVDRIAWKTRQTAQTARTIVREVEWNISHQRNMIPRVLFDTVELAGANISAATGLHGRWIFDNKVGPGTEIEIRRAGDTIPQIIAVHKATGASMPPRYEWDGVHIRPVDGEGDDETATIRLVHALTELGVEHVGPGIVAKLYAAGFKTVGDIYRATPADFVTKVCSEKMSSKIYEGLRKSAGSWTEINLMCASCTMPRGIGHSKLKAMMEVQPNWKEWAATMPLPPGLSRESVASIVESIPAYKKWRADFPIAIEIQSSGPSGPSGPSVAKGNHDGPHMVVVLTGFRDKNLESKLLQGGHEIADTVTKRTTHVVYPDGPKPSSTKITKAEALGIRVLSNSEFMLLC